MENVRWVGRAQAVAQVDTCTIANTWAQGDTATVTINDKTVTLTVGSSVTVTDVATGLKEAINGETLTDTTASYTPANGGPDIPEFQDITATSSAGVVTLTADVAGVPHTITAGETTAGSGTNTLANVTTATGPNHWGNGDNWSGGSKPGTGDVIYFNNSDVDVLYDLDDSTNDPAAIHVEASYTGNIGLPKTNPAGFQEYREDYLKIDIDSLFIGRGDGVGSGRIKIHWGSANVAAYVEKTGAPLESGIPAVLLCGSGTSSSLEMQSGSVGAAIDGTEPCDLDTLRITGGSFYGGHLFAAGTSVTMSGGNVDIGSSVATITISGGDLKIRENVTLTTLVQTGGNIDYQGGNITTATIGGQRGATFDCTNDTTSRTITTCNLNAGGRIVDPLRTITFTTLNRGSDVEELVAT